MAWMVCKPRNSGGRSHRPEPLCLCLLQVCHLPSPSTITNRFFYTLNETCVQGDKRERLPCATMQTLARWYFSICSEGTFLLTFPVKRLVWRWSLYLSGCPCWVIMFLLWCTLTAHFCFLGQKGLFYLMSEAAVFSGGSSMFCGSFWIWHLFPTFTS